MEALMTLEDGGQ